MSSAATWVCSSRSHARKLDERKREYARRLVMVVGSVGVRHNRNNEAIVAGRRYVPEMVVSTEQPRGLVDSRVSWARRTTAAEVHALERKEMSCVCMRCACACSCDRCMRATA